jgi:putative flippase GtrA
MEKVHTLTLRMWGARHKLLRYLISGGSATTINFFVLYACTEWLHVYYLISVVIAFICALGVSFVLQKFWTFKDAQQGDVHRQAVVYTCVAIANTIINVTLVYLLVEFVGVHYLIGQFISSGFIALESYFVYQLFIFKKKSGEIINTPLL